jgi:hypothetical protein
MYQSKLELYLFNQLHNQYTYLLPATDQTEHYKMMADRIAHYLQTINQEHYDVYVLPLDGMRGVDKWAEDNALSNHLIEANTQGRFDFGKYDCGEVNATSTIALPTQIDGANGIRFKVCCKPHRRLWVTAYNALGLNAIAILSFLISAGHILLRYLRVL